ncbi:MAG: HD domain-containing protein [Gemmataceae bacterium]
MIETPDGALRPAEFIAPGAFVNHWPPHFVEGRRRNLLASRQGRGMLGRMAGSRSILAKLCELTPGQRADFFALLTEKTRGLTREGRPFYHCRFRDARRTVSFMAWQDDRWFTPAESEWQVGQFYKLRAVYQEHARYGPQIDLGNLRAVNEGDTAEGFDPADFVEAPRHDPQVLWSVLLELAGQIGDAPLQALVRGLLEGHAERWQRLPLTRDRVYTHPGGLLEHVVNVTRIALDLCTRYAAAYPQLQPPLNRDLVLAGALLHDVGKLVEIDEEQPQTGQTVAGRLIGPLVLGRDLLREAARQTPELRPELLQMLEHILLHPLYTPEGTGPRWTLFPEGLLVQYADDLDVKLAQYVRCLERDTSGGPFTERDPVLGRALFKERPI